VMNDKDEHYLWRKNLAFSGAVTASLSHEINNVLTIINELAGLLDDHMAAAEHGRPLDPDKLKKTTDKIAKQIERGKTIVKRLNSFAHSSDESVASVSLRQLLERITAICERFASLKRAVIESEFPEDDVELTTNPFMLQQAVFSCIQMCLAAADRERRVAVRYEKVDSGAVVLVEGADSVSSTDEVRAEMAFLTLLMRELDGAVEHVPGSGEGSRFRLVLPTVMSGAKG
jgi:C4-dicarboxylate-specific signal transduction histidine kinase